MRKVSIFLVVVFSITTFGVKVNAQKNLDGKSAVVFHYNAVIDEVLMEKVRAYGSEIHNPNYGTDPVKEAIIHNSFYMVKEKLESEVGLFLIAVNSFQDKIKYDEFGYPQITIQKALKKSDSKLFVKINVQYDLEIIPADVEDADNKLLPKVTVSVDVFNEHGYIPIKSAKGSAIAEAPIELTKEFLAGYAPNIKKGDENVVALSDILYKAFDNMQENL